MKLSVKKMVFAWIHKRMTEGKKRGSKREENEERKKGIYGSLHERSRKKRTE